MVTGGSPVSTGVYYDVSWDDRLSAANSNCSRRGTIVSFNEAINLSKTVRLRALINLRNCRSIRTLDARLSIRINICT